MTSAIYSHDIDFHMRDAKGRKIGARARVFRADSTGRLLDTAVGATRYAVQVRATRDGVVFGAVPKSRLTALDPALARAEILRRTTDMIRRYAAIANLRAAGCHARWVDSTTKVTLTIRDTDDIDGHKYDVVCEDHKTCVTVPTLRAARTCSSLDFCDDCRDATP